MSNHLQKERICKKLTKIARNYSAVEVRTLPLVPRKDVVLSSVKNESNEYFLTKSGQVVALAPNLRVKTLAKIYNLVIRF